MKCKSTALLWASGLFWTVLPICTAAAPQKDYLSALDGDKIRDAETPNERIRLFLTFAEDRLKKFQYEIEHPSSNHHGEMLNALLNAYIGCMHDAPDTVQLRREQQDDTRKGIAVMASR